LKWKWWVRRSEFCTVSVNFVWIWVTCMRIAIFWISQIKDDFLWRNVNLDFCDKEIAHQNSRNSNCCLIFCMQCVKRFHKNSRLTYTYRMFWSILAFLELKNNWTKLLKMSIIRIHTRATQKWKCSHKNWLPNSIRLLDSLWSFCGARGKMTTSWLLIHFSQKG